MRNLGLENADIAIQKSGRLTEGTLEWLNENAGTDFPVSGDPFDRLREITDTYTGITVVGYSNGDTVKAVACGQTDLGISGGDMFNEQPNNNLYVSIQKLGFGACKLVLACSEGAVGKPISRIATSYTRLTDAYRRSGDNAFVTTETNIDCFAGGIEMIGRRNNYDAVVDVVDTGESMSANAFCITDTIAEFEAVLFKKLEFASGPDLESVSPVESLSPNEFDARKKLQIPLIFYRLMDEEFEAFFESGGLTH